MRLIHVGSQNQTKIQAAKNILLSSKLFESAEVKGVKIDIEEFGHPKTMEETIRGAKDRAIAAFAGSELSVGLEGGMFEAPYTKTGFLETTACALYDGKDFAIGLSSAYEWPPKVAEMIFNGLDGSQAFKEVGLTDHPKIGVAEGAVSVLTNGRIDRTVLHEQAIIMALIHLENPDHY